MDWNKANIVLIAAFIVLNIFLLSSSFSDVYSEEYNVNTDSEFVENVENILSERNVYVKCELPDEIYVLPTLGTEYEILYVSDELLTRFLGPGMQAIEDVTSYKNDTGEMLEINDGKKLNYVAREKIDGVISYEETIDKKINKFIENKKINAEGYSESFRYISQDYSIVVYTKKYNEFSLDNSYMRFYFDKEGIYRFEMQNIETAKEIAEKIRVFSAAETLPRLLSFDDVRDKEIIEIKMTYYSAEDENWQLISGINSYPVWKVIFNDGTYKHLSGINTYDID